MESIDEFDWPALEEELAAQGAAVLPGVFSDDEVSALIASAEAGVRSAKWWYLDLAQRGDRNMFGDVGQVVLLRWHDAKSRDRGIAIMNKVDREQMSRDVAPMRSAINMALAHLELLGSGAS